MLGQIGTYFGRSVLLFIVAVMLCLAPLGGARAQFTPAPPGNGGISYPPGGGGGLPRRCAAVGRSPPSTITRERRNRPTAVSGVRSGMA